MMIQVIDIHNLGLTTHLFMTSQLGINKTRCTRGVRVVFSVTRMRSSNSVRVNKFEFTTEKNV